MSKKRFEVIKNRKEITSIQELLNLVEKYIAGGDKRIYLRGHQDYGYDLIPSDRRQLFFPVDDNYSYRYELLLFL